MHYRKKKKYYMSTKDADDTLKNILSACDMAPITMSVDKLLLRRKLSTAPYKICLKIILVQIILLLLLPAALWLL